MQSCGECTMCCKLPAVPEVPTKIDEVCRHCTMGSATGCAIYNRRPDACRTYQCMWSQMEHVGKELRPDRSGIIFDRAGDDVITARIEIAREMSDLVKNQIQAFVKEGFSVLMFRGPGYRGFLKPGHTKEYVMGVVRGRAELH